MTIIGIISYIKPIDNNPNAVIAMDYVKSVVKGGAMPLVIPVIHDEAYMTSIMDVIDGLLIPGGGDVNPAIYHEPKLPVSEGIDDELDAFELGMIQLARKAGKPILGICRGFQILNVAYNGTLYQDISLYPGYHPDIIHEQKSHHIPKQEPVHEVSFVPGTKLAKIYGEKTQANSFHHQIAAKLGKGLVASAYTADGVIEGIESTEDAFVIGAQWHPEKTVDYYEEQMVIFKAFVNACKRSKQ